MNILTIFTPEIALLFFAFLILFFLSISFPSNKTTLIIVALYVWRACALAFADLAQSYVSPDFRNIDYVLMAADATLALFVYWLLKRVAFLPSARMPWFVALMMNVLALGLFVSSLFLLFPVEMGTVFPRVGPMLFATSAMNALWLFAPLLVLGMLLVVPKKFTRTKVKIT